ncbi:MAG: dihydrofolate reductase, partial [Bacteroidia bacterium]|nr:dihydrofolate reductase [Bacteroidia bacterium]
DNDLPWHLPGDLKFFKETTMGKYVLMGRKSFESIGRPLPGRTNIVVTRNRDFYHSGVIISNSISDGILLAKKAGVDELFILGGSNIYHQTINLWDKLYITRVNAHIDNATAFFPGVVYEQWKLVSEEPHTADEKNKYDYSFCVYHRK